MTRCVMIEGVCSVCGSALQLPIVRCPACDTPHHQDCWDYNRGCSIYGCSQVADAVIVALSPEPTPVVISPQVAARAQRRLRLMARGAAAGFAVAWALLGFLRATHLLVPAAIAMVLWELWQRGLDEDDSFEPTGDPQVALDLERKAVEALVGRGVTDQLAQMYALFEQRHPRISLAPAVQRDLALELLARGYTALAIQAIDTVLHAPGEWGDARLWDMRHGALIGEPAMAVDAIAGPLGPEDLGLSGLEALTEELTALLTRPAGTDSVYILCLSPRGFPAELQGPLALGGTPWDEVPAQAESVAYPAPPASAAPAALQDGTAVDSSTGGDTAPAVQSAQGDVSSTEAEATTEASVAGQPAVAGRTEGTPRAPASPPARAPAAGAGRLRLSSGTLLVGPMTRWEAQVRLGQAGAMRQPGLDLAMEEMTLPRHVHLVSGLHLSQKEARFLTATGELVFDWRDVKAAILARIETVEILRDVSVDYGNPGAGRKLGYVVKTREVLHRRPVLEVHAGEGPIRLRIDDPMPDLFRYLGRRRESALSVNLALVAKDIARFGPSVRLSHGIHYLLGVRQGTGATFPSPERLEEYIAWFFALGLPAVRERWRPVSEALARRRAAQMAATLALSDLAPVPRTGPEPGTEAGQTPEPEEEPGPELEPAPCAGPDRPPST